MDHVLHFFEACWRLYYIFFVPLYRSPIKVIMTKSKLVSVRIDEDLLAKVDEIALKEQYYSRSSMIEAGLQMIVAGYQNKQVQKPWMFHPRWDEITEFVFKYRRKIETWPKGV